jgi:acetyltransferase
MATVPARLSPVPQHDATTSSLDAIFKPRSIAVVGASRDPRKLGYVFLDNILRARFDGPVHPVNVRAETVLGLHAYDRVSAIPGGVELAVITVPAAAVPSVLEDCGAVGVRGAVVVTAGFREIGAEGLAREERIAEIARRHGIRMIGPNTLGVINTTTNLNATFAETPPLRNDVAVISQSGAIATAILDWARAIGAGFSTFVSLGNMADVNELDMLAYLADDTHARLIVMYLEGISDGRCFMELAREITRRKPIVAMKVGRSAAGARAAASHTGSLAATDAIVDAALKQSGVIRAYTMDELFDYTLAFSYLAPPAGKSLAVVTNAGGPGVMTADAIDRAGLRLATLSDASITQLRGGLPEAASVSNPIDVLGDAPSGRYQFAIEVALADPAVDGVIVLLTPQAVTEPEATSRVIANLARMHEKPIVAVYMGGDAVARGRIMLDTSEVPAYHYPERAVRAMAALERYGRYLRDA